MERLSDVSIGSQPGTRSHDLKHAYSRFAPPLYWTHCYKIRMTVHICNWRIWTGYIAILDGSLHVSATFPFPSLLQALLRSANNFLTLHAKVLEKERLRPSQLSTPTKNCFETQKDSQCNDKWNLKRQIFDLKRAYGGRRATSYRPHHANTSP